MNCLEFRREKLADPRRMSDTARAHVQSCAGCTAFARGVDESDSELARALSIPVPEGLADRVLLRASSIGRPAWRIWALAATVVLGVGLTTALFVYLPSDPNARLAIEHVVHEPESLTTLYQADGASVEVALRSVGASVRSPLWSVRYVRLCPWGNGGTAWHVVFETPHGLATLLLVPQKHVWSRSDATANGLSALIQPVRRGFYAIVTSSPATTEHVAELLRERVDWNA